MFLHVRRNIMLQFVTDAISGLIMYVGLGRP